MYLTSDREGKERLDRGQFRERDSWADTLRVVKEGRGGAEYHRHQEKETQERSCYEENKGSKEVEIQRLTHTEPHREESSWARAQTGSPEEKQEERKSQT